VAIASLINLTNFLSLLFTSLEIFINFSIEEDGESKKLGVFLFFFIYLEIDRPSNSGSYFQLPAYILVDCRSLLTNHIIDEFVSVLKDWQIVFQQYPLNIEGASYA